MSVLSYQSGAKQRAEARLRFWAQPARSQARRSHWPQSRGLRGRGLTGGKNARLAALAHTHRAKRAVIADQSCYAELRDALSGSGIEVAAGSDAVAEAAALSADWVMGAIVGVAGLKPTLEAVRQGTCTAIANKECLVAAGELFMSEVARHRTRLLPVDSEHSAVYQVLADSDVASIDKIYLTASGGPFRSMSRDDMARVTPEQALIHPNWSMGPKVTIDSATLMNKGLELIEAYHLFGLRTDQLDVLIHPQSSCIACSTTAMAGAGAMSQPICARRSPIALPGRSECTRQSPASILPSSARSISKRRT
jgi:1-deoxy-D-xylulose-5-phosphate reductoisomerase